jgi:hypothetical protein
MSKYHDHRSDCPFKFASLDVCDCVEHNMLDRIEALTAENEMLGREVNIARYGQPDFAWSVHVQVMDDLNAKLAAAVDWFETIRDRAKGDYMAHTYYLDALAALATIKRREP